MISIGRGREKKFSQIVTSVRTFFYYITKLLKVNKKLGSHWKQPLAFPDITGYNGLRLQKVRCRNEFYFSQIIQINERMCG